MTPRGKRAALISAGAPALLGTLAAVLCRPAGGPLLTHDSLAYLHAAETFANGEGFIYFGFGTPVIQWTPFTPALYALIGVFTDNVAGWAGALNYLFLSGALFFANMAAGEVIEKPVFRVPAQLTLSFSFAVILNTYYLWSEAPFFLFLTLMFFLFFRYLKGGGSGMAALTGAAGGLLMWTRYTGMGFAALIGVFILLFTKRPLKTRLRDAAVYGAAAGVPFAGWLLRNLILSGSVSGRASPNIHSFARNVKDTALRVAEWFVPNAGTLGTMAVLLVLTALFVFMGGSLFVLLRREGKAVDAGVWFLISQCGFYIAMTVYTASRYALEGSTPRIMAPAFFPFAMLLFSLLERGAGLGPKRSIKASAVCAVAVAVCAAGLNMAALASNGPALKGHFTEENLAGDEIAAFLKTLDAASVLVYSDRPSELFFLTGMTVNYPPKPEGVRLYTQDACLERLEASGRSPVVAWYGGQPEQMGRWIETLGLERTAQFAAGGVYQRVP